MHNQRLCIFMLALEYMDAPLKDLDKVVQSFYKQIDGPFYDSPDEERDESITLRDLVKKHMPSKVRDSSFTHIIGDGM